MSIKVYIPLPLRPECNGASELEFEAETVRALLALIEQEHPALYRSVCDETGAVRRHVNLFVGDEFIRNLDGLDTRLKTGDEVTIMPAVSGG